MFKINEYLTVFWLGAIGYTFIEILWRGKTHWTMGLLGGICVLFIYFQEGKSTFGIFGKAFVSTCFITVSELAAGLLLNKTLSLDIWDYSDIPLNFLGQISLLYSVFWFLLCIPAHLLCRIIKHRVFDVLSNGQKSLKGDRAFGKENELSEQ